MNTLMRFFIYGFMGWAMEIIWTGLGSFVRKDYRLMGNTSIWMLFIYGGAVLLEPVCDFVAPWPLVARGTVYMLCIFAVEYTTGRLLCAARICPWDYSSSRLSVQGVIRLDYAPVWFGVGLIFERVYYLLT